MRNLAFTVFLLGFTAGMAAADGQTAGRLSVPVSGLRNDNGVVRCGLYAGAGASPRPDGKAEGSSPRSKGDRRPASSAA